MKNRWKTVWRRFLHRLDEYAVALDPIGDLHAGIGLLEDERMLRSRAFARRSLTPPNQTIRPGRH